MTSGGSRGIGKIMNKRTSLVLLFVLIPLTLPVSVLPAQITIDSDDQFQFAKETMEKGEYLRAVAEFERFIHLFPEDEKVPEARYLIGFCYLQAKDYDSARGVLGEVYQSYADSPIGGKALILIGESYYRQGNLEGADRHFSMVVEKYPQPELKNAAIYRLAWTRMKENKWQEASETFMRVEKESRLYLSAQELSRASLKGELLPYKDPTTAGVLAVIPGLGHVYCNRYKDGLVALLLNGLTIWAAIEAFDEDVEVVGGILIFLGVGFYAGNIYSAVNSAHKYNRKARNDFRQTLPDRLKFNLFTSKHGHLGLALSLEF